MSKKLTWIGIAITVAYLIAATLLGWGQWDEFSAMKPNEVGYFLAGVVGPLALLWLILGYFQQGEELKQSTRALQLQAEELRNSVEQQQQLVAVSREQVDTQLKALEGEQERYRIANRPHMVLRKRMSVSNGAVLDQSFDLQNLGADAFNVEMSMTPAWDGKLASKRSSLRRGDSLGFSLVISPSNAGRFVLHVQCFDALQNVVEAEFHLDVVVLEGEGPRVHIQDN